MTADTPKIQPMKFNVNDIVMHFAREYYTMMSCEPERLHCFYGAQSSLLHSLALDNDAPVCVGLDEINERIVAFGYKGTKVVITSIDCQSSLNGGILIFIIGNLYWPQGIIRKFSHTFVLAEQPNGYFILNDIMRMTPQNEDSLEKNETIKPLPSQADDFFHRQWPSTLEAPAQGNSAPQAPKDSPHKLVKNEDLPSISDNHTSWATLASEKILNECTDDSLAEKSSPGHKRPVKVDHKPMGPKPSDSHKRDYSKSIYLSLPSSSISRDQIKASFAVFGNIKSVDLYESKGIAFVEFELKDARETALKNRTEIDGKSVRVAPRHHNTNSGFSKIYAQREFDKSPNLRS